MSNETPEWNAENIAKIRFERIRECLRPYVAIDKESRLLEVGSGDSAVTRYLQNSGYDITAVDRHPEDDEGLQTVKAQIERMPFDETDSNQCFDVIFGLSVFDTSIMPWQNMSAMITEMSRVLDPEGYIYLSNDHMTTQDFYDGIPDVVEVVVRDDNYTILKKKIN